MLSQQYYVLRSRGSGEYLVAHPTADASEGFLLLFPSDYEALSYVNTHSPGSSCTVESLATNALPMTLTRWQLVGIGIVNDPLVPHIQFLRVDL
jgi:hypothetical protein